MTARSRASKIGIVGAGAVGTSIAYACLIRGSARQVALYDIDTAKVEAEVLDLAHGAMFLSRSAVTGGDDIEVLRDSDVVIITAGAKQKPGQTRLDLAATNAKILESFMPRLVELAPDAIFVLVTNPCDVLTIVAQQIVDLPRGRVMSSGTLLDSSRLRWALARMAGGVAESAVHAMIVGEHGDSEFALWSQASIGPVPILEWEFEGRLPFDYETLDRVTQEVRSAAYRVIEGKGATNYAIGLSSARIAEAILRDEHTILPVSSVLEGEWGLDGVALSLPSVVGRRGVERILDLPITKQERVKLNASAEAIMDTLRQIGRA